MAEVIVVVSSLVTVLLPFIIEVEVIVLLAGLIKKVFAK